MTKIRDIMEKEVYTCSSKATVLEVMEYLYDKAVSGVPIVDENFKVKGFISDGDIMKRVSNQNALEMGAFESPILWIDNATFEEKVKRLMETNVMEIAAKHVVTIDADDSIDDAAHLLSKKKIKKVPVLENGNLVGVVSRSTMIRHMMQDIVTKVKA